MSHDGVANLHMHTTASDGTCSVADRVDQAQERGLNAIAVTDHDTISEDIDGRASVHGDLEFVTGVEVRADVQGTKVEFLGYYVDPTDETLAEVLEQVQEYRRDRNRRLIECLQDVSGLKRSYEDVQTTANGILGLPHRGCPRRGGFVKSIGEAFDEYLGADGIVSLAIGYKSCG